MKNDLKRFEIADAQADCTVAGLAGSFHPLAWTFFGGWGGGVRAPSLDSRAFPVTAVHLSRGGGSSTGREAAWDRWTSPAPPPTTAPLIKDTSPPLRTCVCTRVVCQSCQLYFKSPPVEAQSCRISRCSIFIFLFFFSQLFSSFLLDLLLFEASLSAFSLQRCFSRRRWWTW